MTLFKIQFKYNVTVEGCPKGPMSKFIGYWEEAQGDVCPKRKMSTLQGSSRPIEPVNIYKLENN